MKNSTLNIRLISEDAAVYPVLQTCCRNSEVNMMIEKFPSINLMLASLKSNEMNILVLDTNDDYNATKNILSNMPKLKSDLYCLLLINDYNAIEIQDLYKLGVSECILKNRLELDFTNTINHYLELVRLRERISLEHSRVEYFLYRLKKNQKENTELLMQMKMKNDELSFLVHHDTLTKLPNRRQFAIFIAEAISSAKRHNRLMALLYIDIDNFKTINDTLGHSIGDSLLQDVARRLKARIRKEDFIARISGDEFVVILTEISNEADAGMVAENLLSSLEKSFHIEDKDVHASVSIGIACYPSMGDDVESLEKNADIALYRAKNKGRNNYQYFTTSGDQQHMYELKLGSDLRFAIERNELFIMYQPKYNLNTNKIVGMEALLRWNHPQLGIVSPDEFIPVAEDLGLLIPIGDWVFRAGCAQLAIWHAQGIKGYPLAINLSPTQLFQENLVSFILSILKDSNLSATDLELEVTETSILGKREAAEGALQSLHEAGIHILIDDFGTGFSSLRHLKELPVNGLKIDKSFVMDLNNDKNCEIIIRSIVELANNLKLDVIAEGVEEKYQQDFLQKLGCPKGQGYYFSRPLSVEDITQLLKRQG